MSNRDIGIRALIPGQRSPDEIKEDQNTRKYVETIVNHTPQVHPREENLGETLVRTTPSLNLTNTSKVETKEAKEAKDFKSEKEYENHLVSRPTKADHKRAYNQGVKEWIEGPGYDHNARSLKDEEKLGKDNWLKNQKMAEQLRAFKEYHQPTPVGLGDKYKSDIRKPVEKKRNSYNAKVEAKTDPTKGAHYTPWYERMAAEEAEALNNIKRTTWEQGGRVKPEPKYVTAQDVQNVYKPKQPEATPLQMKNLHKRLENHNEMTGQFKHIPKEEEDPRTEGRMEELQKIEDKGKSWLSKHLKKENKQPTLPGVNWGQSKRII